MRLSVFAENDKVLLVGEGNFSFTVSLVKHNLPITITTSCYDPSIVHEDTTKNVEFLRSQGIQVELGIDATRLTDYDNLNREPFDKIIFNFPHVGGKMRLDKNRELLKSFFICAEKFLAPNGSILMTLCNGQGGTLADSPQRLWTDTWKVKEMAAHGNFLLSGVEPFVTENFLDYSSTGYRGLNKEFYMTKAWTHFFKKAPPAVSFGPRVKGNFSELRNTDKPIRYVDIFTINRHSCSLNPPIYKFDLTFSVNANFKELYLFELVYNYFGEIVRDVEFIRSYTYPDNTVKKTYRITYQSDSVPLHRKKIIDIHHNDVANLFESNLNVMVTK